MFISLETCLSGSDSSVQSSFDMTASEFYCLFFFLDKMNSLASIQDILFQDTGREVNSTLHTLISRFIVSRIAKQHISICLFLFVRYLK